MTHGEETGPETHQDSAVLTYLEGLLMHRVAGAQGATATPRGEAGSGSEEERNKETTGLAVPITRPDPDKTTSHGGTTQHLRKARLLRSEAWTEHESQRRSTPAVELNGQKDEHHSGLNGSSQCKGESTLLASLLQSFSTRLQNVALSKQIVQSLVPQDAASPDSKSEEADKATTHSDGSSSSQVRSLTGKRKVQDYSSSEPCHQHRSSQERLSESPLAVQNLARSPSSESLPCTERLKAVASLVNIRSSPAPSPKPSVACSQLALLLSSEAHLQQYSREQALKAQLAGRSASERLAAIATQQTQEKKQPATSGQSQANQDRLSSLQAKNGIPAQMSTVSSRQSPSLSTGQSRSEGSVQRTHPFRERRPFERHGRPSQNCSSLLLQLLNSHNTPQRLNCKGHLKEDISTFSSQGSPMFSDSEHSNPASSLPKDSSDAESTHSSCSPIDLSLKTKVNIATPLSSSSSPGLDKATESLKNRWKSESPTGKFPTEPKELYPCPEMKPHHKITLLELLLDHKNNEKTNKGLDNPDLQAVTIPKVTSASTSNQTLFYPGRCKDTRELSPTCTLNSRSPKVLPTFSQGRDGNSQASPYTLYSPPHTQSVPLDLCKNKPPASGINVKEAAFSASKLLQNLAQCGKQNTATSPSPKAPLPPIKRQTQELKTSSSSAILDRLTVPVPRNSSTPTWDRTHAKAPVVVESSKHGSEIENLLERRTVLQLLLGNKSQKDRTGYKRKREIVKSITTEKQPIHSNSHINLNRPSPDIFVKTEPFDDAEMHYDDRIKRQCENIVTESPRPIPHALNQESIKQEPLSPVSVHRDGLLCHLLQQQPITLKPNTLEDSNKDSVKEEPEEHQGPTIPKKRKIVVEPEDQVKVSHEGNCISSGIQKDNSDCSTSGIPDTQESIDPSSPPEADSPPVKVPPCESLCTESRGFNVLKQLLLSDNCLKELSQSRSTFSPLAHPVLNGGIVKEPSSNGELHHFNQSLSKGSTVRAGVNRPESLLHVHETQQDPSRAKPSFIIQRAAKSRDSLVNGDDNTPDCQIDSPQLTKANPILYYMLQRSNAHLVRDGGQLEAKSGQCRVQMKVKEESEAFDFQLNLQQNHNGTHSCDSPRLNGSLKKS